MSKISVITTKETSILLIYSATSHTLQL